MRALLAERRPEDGGPRRGVSGGRRARSGLTWVLDPIDGTRAFISGAPTWGTLIGLDAGDGPVLGLIDQPYTASGSSAASGAPRWPRRGRARRCGPAPAPAWRTRCSTPPFPRSARPPSGAGFEAVRDRVRLTRYGFDCYAYALVALGQVDLVIEAGLHDLRHPGAAGGDRGGGRRASPTGAAARRIAAGGCWRPATRGCTRRRWRSSRVWPSLDGGLPGRICRQAAYPRVDMGRH